MKPSPVHILIVDDDEDDFFILREYISKIEEQQFVIDWCYRYSEALDYIKKGAYHIYFIDYRLGANTGLQLIQEAVKSDCEEPLILLTGNGNRLIDMEAMESGAVDYLVKGELNTEKLERCIRYSLERTAFLKVLSSNERKFRSIFERSKDLVFIADEQLRFIEVNNASVAMLGYDKTELMGKRLYHIMVNSSDAEYITAQLSAGNDITDKEAEIYDREGEKKYCVITLSREKDNTGVTYIQGIIHDVSSMKRAEKATLIIEKLNIANRLTRIMAHEVRNPLSNIMLSAEQMEGHMEAEEDKQCLEIIGRNSKRIGKLISDLLNSLRSEPLSMEKKALQVILEETLDAALDRLSLRHIQLQKVYPDEPALIYADNEKLKIAFLNIIINAIESMKENEGELVVSVDRKNDQYIVSIRDNGCGISDEGMLRLFEPYFTSKKNGMGLGLASALNILQAHNATYDVKSRVDNGTVFNLFFSVAAD